MKRIKTDGLIFLLILFGHIVYGQTNEEKAFEKGVEAIKLMDDGEVDVSIKLLKEAQKLDPERFDYPYELAYAYYQNNEFKKAIKTLQKIKNHKDVSDLLYQMLGNCYDVMGNPDKAFEAYNEGLKKFPYSGKIYLEKGNVHWGREEYAEALSYYEKGIEVEPQFPSNYYRATIIYCNSDESVWGLIYGEIFMILEPSTKRTITISKMLYDTYNNKIQIYGDSTKIDFCKVVVDATDVIDKDNIKLPFCFYFGQAFITSIIDIKSININSLDTVRTKFIESYYENEYDKKYPNILYDYQYKILKAGHLESYNHWILGNGDEEAFEKWHESNKEEWEDFANWFSENELIIDHSNKFFSGQY